MKAYDAITNNNNGVNFPLTRAIDSSGPLATDGTEIVKEVVDDVWLQKQALIDFYYPLPAGPNSFDDLPGVEPAFGWPNSQPLAAQYLNYGTPGSIINWPSQIDPVLLGNLLGEGLVIRLLLLHGQGINRTLDDFKMLNEIVYVGDGANPTADSFYHADDALGTIRNPAGDWLILPDARGYSFRALDPSGLIDPDGAGRILGSKQEDALQEITGEFLIMQKEGGANNNVVFQSAIPSALAVEQDFITGTTITQIASASSPGDKPLDRVFFNASSSPGTKVDPLETRAKNIATDYAIHY